MPKCEDCRHLGKPVPDMTWGECHRFPPPTSGTGGFPFVYLSDWCGEFKPKDPTFTYVCSGCGDVNQSSKPNLRYDCGKCFHPMRFKPKESEKETLFLEWAEGLNPPLPRKIINTVTMNIRPGCIDFSKYPEHTLEYAFYGDGSLHSYHEDNCKCEPVYLSEVVAVVRLEKILNFTGIGNKSYKLLKQLLKESEER